MMRLFECKVKAVSSDIGNIPNYNGVDEFTVMVAAENAKSAKTNGEKSILKRFSAYESLEFTSVREIKLPFSIILPRNIGYAKEYSDWVRQRGGYLALDSQKTFDVMEGVEA